MNNKTIAIAIAAIMAMTAFAAVGVFNGDSADASNGQTTIIGSAEKPYALSVNNSIDAKIKYNYSAFTSSAVVAFSYAYAMKTTETTGTGNIYAATTAESATAVKINGINTKIIGSNGSYTVNFTGKEVTSLTECTKIDFALSVTDKVNAGGNIVDMPTQTYTFTAYLIVVDNDSKTIKLEDFNGTFAYEKAYHIGASVVDSNDASKTLDGYKFYATGLPSGLSMTVEGIIGGTLNGTGNSETGSFTVYAVSVSGHVVSKIFNYDIPGHTNKDFSINVKGTTDTKNYATLRVGETLTLEIKPSSTYELSNLEASSPGIIIPTLVINENVGTVTVTFDGTGTSVITISADVGGAKVVKTFTVYVVGQIVSTDLDPVVSSS